MVLTLSVVWALASGLGLAALGGALAALKPRRAPTLLFAAFCLAWGGQVVAANAARAVSPDPSAGLLLRLSLAFLLPTTVFLAHFGAGYPRRAEGPARFVPWAFTAAAGAAAALMVVQPAALLEGYRAGLQGPVPDYGWAAVPLVFAPFYLAFVVAALGLLRTYQRAKGVARQQARLLLAGFLLFTSYANVQNLATPLLRPDLLPLIDPGFLVVFGVGTAATLGIVAWLGLARQPEGPDPLLLVAGLAPVAVFALEEALRQAGLATFDTLGLWRLGTVALVAYAMARYQLFDLDLKLRGVSRRAMPVGAAAVVGAVVLTALEPQGFALALPVALVAAAPAALAAWRFREPASNLLFPAEGGDPEYLYHRKLEVYRAALEQLLAEDAADPAPADKPSLRQLRRSLGLTEREHQVLEFVVRKSLGAQGQPRDAPPRAEPGATLLGRYRVERLLGEGAHGRAYLAHDQKLNREVVVKAVGTSMAGGKAARMLLREARLAGSIHHENIVAIHDVAEAPHEAIIVMEFADGGSLYGLLRRKGKLRLEEAVAILDQVLAGLEAAHKKDVVHRDIKPENILLMRDGTVKVADFGVARDTRPDATGITQGAMGTLLYMSPEQVRGGQVDGRSDLYAAAVVFHQALTGRFYLRIAGRDDFQVRQLILRGQPKLEMKEHPAWVEAFLLKALAKDPAKRFQGAADMRKALRKAAPLKAA